MHYIPVLAQCLDIVLNKLDFGLPEVDRKNTEYPITVFGVQQDSFIKLLSWIYFRWRAVLMS